MRSAVAISPSTPSNAVTDKLGNSVDMILVMTVVPGKYQSSSRDYETTELILEPLGFGLVGFAFR